jgi:hypothetical protein
MRTRKAVDDRGAGQKAKSLDQTFYRYSVTVIVRVLSFGNSERNGYAHSSISAYPASQPTPQLRRRRRCRHIGQGDEGLPPADRPRHDRARGRDRDDPLWSSGRQPLRPAPGTFVAGTEGLAPAPLIAGFRSAALSRREAAAGPLAGPRKVGAGHVRERSGDRTAGREPAHGAQHDRDDDDVDREHESLTAVRSPPRTGPIAPATVPAAAQTDTIRRPPSPVRATASSRSASPTGQLSSPATGARAQSRAKSATASQPGSPQV